MEQLQRLVRAVDDYQQRHRWLAFPVAVAKKYGDDQAGHHAALLAYYGFFSLFPLLLVAVTVIGFILQGRLDLGQRIVDSALGQFPIIGEQIRDEVQGSRLRASATYGTFALVIWLLSWLYLASTVTLLAAELNVVRSRRLWPRSLAPPPLGGADDGEGNEAGERPAEDGPPAQTG